MPAPVRIVTLPWGGQAAYDPTTRTVTPLTNAWTSAPVPERASPAPGYTFIAPATNAPVGQSAPRVSVFAKPPEAYPLASFMTPQQSFDFRRTTDELLRDYGWAMGQFGLTAEEAAEMFGD